MMHFSFAVWTAFFSIIIVDSLLESADDPNAVLDGLGDEGILDQPSNDGLTVATNPTIEVTNSAITGKTACSGDSGAKFRKRDLIPTAPWISFNRECPNPSDYGVDKQPAPAPRPESTTSTMPTCLSKYSPVCCWTNEYQGPRPVAKKQFRIVEDCEHCTFRLFCRQKLIPCRLLFI